MKLPTGRQIRAARNLLNISAETLASRIGTKPHSIYRLEKKESPPLAVRLCAALEADGIRFVDGGVILQETK
jgi:transcriptional regulator with XRE-family HTH domain